MQGDKIDLLVTLDKKYIKLFRVMLKSLAVSNPQGNFRIWLLHSGISNVDLQALAEYCSGHRMTLIFWSSTRCIHYGKCSSVNLCLQQLPIAVFLKLSMT